MRPRPQSTAAALHVSPPAKGVSASPVIRYCVIDDARQTPAWVVLDDVHETRALADKLQRPQWGVVGSMGRGRKFISGEPRSG